MNYYNDNDAAIAQWLRNLIAAGLVPDGEVDQRPIQEVTASDVKGFTQAHFFCGILGWPLALQLAGWPPDHPVWTGSCPCQPFSSAGKRLGVADKRHLWPQFRRLIAECKPDTVFGEQVDGADGLQWLAGVHADLEALGYAFGAVGLPAACMAAPHRRQRLWWVADASGAAGERDSGGIPRPQEEISRQDGAQHGDCFERLGNGGATGGLDYAAGDGAGCAGTSQQGSDRTHDGVPGASGAWNDSAIVWCDERAFGRGYVPRRVEPGVFPLAPRVPGDVVKIRAYGNAIVPQIAAEFIRAYMNIL